MRLRGMSWRAGCVAARGGLLSTVVALCVLLAPAVSTAAAAAAVVDEAVEILDGVPGRLREPAGEAVGAVLLLHGFNGTMDEVGDLYRDLATALAERGLASLRIGFSGEGPGVGYRVTSTLGSRVAEAEAGLALLRQRFPGVPYGVNGFSLGGLTAMAIAPDHDDIDAMVLWSAAASIDLARDPEAAAAVRQALSEGEGTYSAWTDITLTREFLLSFIGVDASAGLRAFSGDLLAIRGNQDYLPALDAEWIALAPGSRDEVIVIDGADHIFNVLETPRPDYGARVIEHSAHWFARRLIAR